LKHLYLVSPPIYQRFAKLQWMAFKIADSSTGRYIPMGGP
jgi:hypothetical protein